MRTQYEQAAEMWNNLRREFLYAQELADAANMAAGVDKKRNTMLWRAYWAAHQRFFRSMCMAAKVGRRHLRPCQAVQHGPLCSICTTKMFQHELLRSRPCCNGSLATLSLQRLHGHQREPFACEGFLECSVTF